MNAKTIKEMTLVGQTGILTVIQILTFVDKKKTKKLINLSELINKLKQALKTSSTYTIYYVNNYFINFLNLLKKHGYIFNYFIIPEVFFKDYLKFGYKEKFYNRLALIFFSGYKLEEVSLKIIKLVSKPSRQIYIDYVALNKLVFHKNTTSLYVLNTTKGLIGHTEALQHKIGGNLMCVVY